MADLSLVEQALLIAVRALQEGTPCPHPSAFPTWEFSHPVELI